VDWCTIGRHHCSSDTRKERAERVAGILPAHPPSHYPAKFLVFQEPKQRMDEHCCSKLYCKGKQ
jgi:hypothetical protein